MTDGAPQPSQGEARRWMAKAAEDLAVADLVLGSAVGVNWAACFHAQQAAEKALKSVLVLHGIDFPRSHALDRLAALLPQDIARLFDSRVLAVLTPWAVAGRYPEDIENPSDSEAGAVVAGSQRITAVAKRLLSGASPSDNAGLDAG